MTKKRFLEVACAVAAGSGLVILLGTAGASDAGGSISLQQVAVRAAVGLVMFAGAGYLGGLTR
ncbi:MAG: hypothetical protein LBK75_08565 [Oscillospiraceae bacterium]|nr:hypothetical protein [Oscillospiraceae bacterium]